MATRIASSDFFSDALCWLRPRDPWMFNRAVVQPDPVINLSMVTNIPKAACWAASPDDLFQRMEAAGVMLRVDPRVTPSMAKTLTLAHWEQDRLKAIENVVRLGHVRHVQPGRLVCVGGEAGINRDVLVVHCAASGLRYEPLVPVWGSQAITLQCAQGSQALAAQPDVKTWSHATSLYRSRIPAECLSDPAVVDAVARVQAVTQIGMSRLAELGGMQ